jgi:hypothetical protein
MSEFGTEATQDDATDDGLPVGEHLADDTVTSPDTGSRYAADGVTEATPEDEFDEELDAPLDDSPVEPRP